VETDNRASEDALPAFARETCVISQIYLRNLVKPSTNSPLWASSCRCFPVQNFQTISAGQSAAVQQLFSILAIKTSASPHPPPPPLAAVHKMLSFWPSLLKVWTRSGQWKWLGRVWSLGSGLTCSNPTAGLLQGPSNKTRFLFAILIHFLIYLHSICKQYVGMQICICSEPCIAGCVSIRHGSPT
jgi:hypothetical protein